MPAPGYVLAPSIMQPQYPCPHNNPTTHWCLHYSWRIPPVAPQLYYICPIGRVAGSVQPNKRGICGEAAPRLWRCTLAAPSLKAMRLFILFNLYLNRTRGLALRRELFHRCTTIISYSRVEQYIMYNDKVKMSNGSRLKILNNKTGANFYKFFQCP